MQICSSSLCFHSVATLSMQCRNVLLLFATVSTISCFYYLLFILEYLVVQTKVGSSVFVVLSVDTCG